MDVQQQQSNLQEQLICPIYFTPLTDAVSLIPCMHKIGKIAALELFGETDGWKIKPSQNKCPLCRASVEGYAADHTVRNIAKLLFELPEEMLKDLIAKMKSFLAEKSMCVEKGELLMDVQVPYPGKPAKFVYEGGDWNIILYPKTEISLCREVNFISTTRDSFIKNFELLGYRDGVVRIRVIFSDEKNARKYLKEFGIDMLNYYYTSKNTNEIKILFNILAQNNEIPESHFEMLRDIVAKGKHEM